MADELTMREIARRSAERARQAREAAGEEPKEALHLNLTRRQADYLRRLARQEEVSISEVARRLLSQVLVRRP